MNARGRLITIEGVDGAGKTTLAAGLERALADAGVQARLLREPGGVQAAEAVRALVKDPALTVGPRTEALLYAAARAQLVEEALEPRLAAGEWVLLDRFIDSSLAYQGIGRGLGIEAIAEINAFATGGLVPDLTLLLDLPPGLGRSRTSDRGGAADRLEREHDDFFARIADGYRELAAREPERFAVLDASRPPDAVLDAALDAVSGLV